MNDHASTESYDNTIAAVRAEAYQLLAHAFRTPELSDTWLGDGFVVQWRKLADLLPEQDRITKLLNEIEVAFKADHDEPMLVYDAMFEAHGGLAAPPYETEYIKITPQHGLNMTTEMADVAGFYHAFGLNVADHFGERPDHIAAELEFMHVMVRKEIFATEQSDSEHLKIVRDAQCLFLKDHLARWPQGFAERIADSSESGAYKPLSQLLSLWVAKDADYFELEQPSLCSLCPPQPGVAQ